MGYVLVVQLLLAGIRVGASIPPLAGWVQMLGGADVEVICMLQSGQTPHAYSPGPSLYRTLQGVQGVVYVGPGVDQAWVRRVLRALSPSPRALALGKDRPRQDDPHVWLSLNALDTLTDTLARWLGTLIPEQRAAIRARAAQYRARLEAVRDSLLRTGATGPGSPVVLSHTAWIHLFGELDIPVVGILHPVPEQPPGPRTLARLMRRAQTARVKWVIVDAGRRDAVAEAVAREVGGRILALDPLGTCAHPEDPLTLILKNLKHLHEAGDGRD